MLGFSRKGTPAKGLEVITHTPPLHHQVEMVAAQEHLRTKKKSRYLRDPLITDLKTCKGHRQISEENLKRWGFSETNIGMSSFTDEFLWVGFKNWVLVDMFYNTNQCHSQKLLLF